MWGRSSPRSDFLSLQIHHHLHLVTGLYLKKMVVRLLKQKLTSQCLFLACLVALILHQFGFQFGAPKIHINRNLTGMYGKAFFGQLLTGYIPINHLKTQYIIIHTSFLSSSQLWRFPEIGTNPCMGAMLLTSNLFTLAISIIF